MPSEPKSPDLRTSTPADVWSEILRRTELFAESVKNFMRELGVPDDPDAANELLSEALLVEVLRQIGAHGELRMPRAKFRQIVSERFELPVADSRPTGDELRRRLRELLASARGEDFENGHDTTRTRDLVRLVCQSGPDAVRYAADLIADGTIDPEVAAATLETFGEMWDRSSATERRRVLEECLLSSSATVRQGAVIGLAHLSDGDSLAALQDAAATEADPVLRDVIIRVINRLREVNLGAAASEAGQSKPPPKPSRR